MVDGGLLSTAVTLAIVAAGGWLLFVVASVLLRLLAVLLCVGVFYTVVVR